MCEYCGCQDVEVIAELTAEHDRLRELARDLTDAADRDDLVAARVAADTMRTVLEPHTSVEEGALFPAMAGDFGGPIAALIAEHLDIDLALSRIADGTAGADWQARACVVAEDLFEHILKEQDGVFPAALSTLRTADWERMAEVRRVAGSTLTVG